MRQGKRKAADGKGKAKNVGWGETGFLGKGKGKEIKCKDGEGYERGKVG